MEVLSWSSDFCPKMLIDFCVAFFLRLEQDLGKTEHIPFSLLLRCFTYESCASLTSWEYRYIAYAEHKDLPVVRLVFILKNPLRKCCKLQENLQRVWYTLENSESGGEKSQYFKFVFHYILKCLLKQRRSKDNPVCFLLFFPCCSIQLKIC